MVLLRLRENELSGPIPVALGLNSQILCLDVAKNRIAGTIPVTVPSNLEQFAVSENQLSGPLVSFVGWSQLLVDNNRLTGSSH